MNDPEKKKDNPIENEFYSSNIYKAIKSGSKFADGFNNGFGNSAQDIGEQLGSAASNIGRTVAGIANNISYAVSSNGSHPNPQGGQYPPPQQGFPPYRQQGNNQRPNPQGGPNGPYQYPQGRQDYGSVNNPHRSSQRSGNPGGYYYDSSIQPPKVPVKKNSNGKAGGWTVVAIIVIISILASVGIHGILAILASIGIGIAGYFAVLHMINKKNKAAAAPPMYNTTAQAPQVQQNAATKKQHSNTGNKELDDVIDEGNDYLYKLQDADVKIADPDISLCIERMEKAASGIFEYVKKKPAKIPQIKKFMNYYLPTTLKLLESYELLDKQSVKGDNIASTMHDISGMMQTIASAFEKQLDGLFSDEAMDIQTDITVFDKILEQEGLKTPENSPTNQSQTEGDNLQL
jgi:5-bromo-4-chloroindolyl phosphate hydrolysis protein